ncbi:hypothetical protein ACFLYO_02180, partial [Chloroflexota bacterium]
MIKQQGHLKQSGIKTFVDATGAARWLTWSSSAYRDRDTNPFTGTGEIVSLDALKTWVVRVHQTGEYGPLLWAHKAELPIGQCDASVVRGAFLLETGTFDDTVLGRAALNYLTEYDGEFGDLGVSIGFACNVADRADGIYDRIEIVERSVLPLMVAANPYTAFQTINKSEGAGSMSNPLKEALDRFAGKLPEQAEAELTAADKATEALDAAGIERKAVDEVLADETTTEPVNTPVDEGNQAETNPVEEVEGAAIADEAADAITEDDLPATAETAEPAAQETASENDSEGALDSALGSVDEVTQLADALEERMTAIATAQAEAAVAQLLGEKAQQAAIQQTVEEQVKALLAEEDGPLQKGLSKAVQWRLSDMLSGVAAAAVSEEVWRQLDQGGPLKDAMDGLATQVTGVLSNLESMASEQKTLVESQKAIDERLDGLAMAPRAMQDAVRRAVWSNKTVVDDPGSQPEQFTPVNDEDTYL